MTAEGEVILLLLAGFVTGVVNTISGSGTLFSLGALIILDIPITLANTSNRPGVFVQNLSGLFSLRKYHNLPIATLPFDIIFITTIGALIGAYYAVTIPEFLLILCASFAMLASLYLVLFPNRIKITSVNKQRGYLKWLLFFLVGLYGGFIQIGVGLLMLAVVSNFVSKDFIQANALKLLIILIYTIPTTLFFIFNDQILWKVALFLAIGQLFGAYLAGIFISIHKNAVVVSKIVTVLFIIITLLKIWIF